MTNQDSNDDHDDHAGENDPLLSPSSLEAQAQGPPLSATASPKSNYRFPRFPLFPGFPGFDFSRFPPATILVPVLVLLVGIITLGTGVTTLLTSCSVRPDQSEQIANLTTRLDATKSSLDVCTRNSTRLGIDLNIERVRLGVCRENGKRLAERVEKVEGDLDWCTNQNLLLEGELKDLKSRKEACETENDKLRRQVEGGAFIDFHEFVGSLGTGGDSWVCSDTTRSWSYGYATERTPHPTITIKTWTAELSDVLHSATPLVFPPPVPPSPPSLAYPRRYSDMRGSAEVAPPGRTPFFVQRIGVPQRTVPNPKDDSIYIIGYTVTSRNISGNNGWWKITKMDAFGIKDGRIEFWALAAKWMGSKSLYDVQVWYVER